MTITPVTDEMPSTGLILRPDELTWFAVHTRSRFEKRVFSELREKGIDSFLPLLPAKHKWSDREQRVHQPLFPGYVLVRIAPAQEVRIAVLRTIGVTNFVGARGMGTPIPNSEIQAIQTLLEQQHVPFELYPYLHVGQRVRIRGGCLDGIEGILTAIDGNESLIVSVQLIRRSIAMRITGYQVEPVPAAGNGTEPGRPTPPREAHHAARDQGSVLGTRGPMSQPLLAKSHSHF